MLVGTVLRRIASLTLLLGLLFVVRAARAESLQAPVGGKSISIGDARVACGAAGGWTVDADPRSVKPPPNDDAIGSTVELKVAASVAACATTTTSVTLIATGRLPTFDAAATTIALDDGRLEVRGKRLKGVRFDWSVGGKNGNDACSDVTIDGAAEKCALAVPHDAPADPKAFVIRWSPAGAHADAITFDADGKRVAADAFTLPVARVLLGKLLSADAAADVTTGTAKIPLMHADAVTTVDCAGATCEIVGNTLAVHGVTAVADKLAIKTHLAPHVFLERGTVLDPAPTLTVTVLHCPLSVVSGQPIAGVDDAKTIVRLEGACAGSAVSYRWVVSGATATVVRTAKEKDGAYVLLAIGRVNSDIAIQALNADGSVVAATHTPTRPAPHPHGAIELKDVGTIEFIPTNRSAIVEVPPIESGRLAVVPVEGAYVVEQSGGAPGAPTTIRGVSKAVGFVTIHYALRADGVPASMQGEDLATLTDALAMPLREANVPAPIGASALGKSPIVELVCVGKNGKLITIAPGETTHVPYDARDSCRFVFHRERVPIEDGAQKLTLEIDVTRVDGAPRPDAHVRDEFVLRPGVEERLAWIKGVGGEFDRVTVRLSHSADESHYVGEFDTGAPSAQWSLVMGTGVARLYATTAIPTGLYRVSDRAHSGILTLNFGVLSRLTWLDDAGHEGVLGLEAGVMGIGLARDTSSTGESLTQVAAVTGIGLSVPIANRSLATETSVNLHAWFEYEVSRSWGQLPGSPYGFVFGPSISIGNIGTNL